MKRAELVPTGLLAILLASLCGCHSVQTVQVQPSATPQGAGTQIIVVRAHGPGQAETVTAPVAANHPALPPPNKKAQSFIRKGLKHSNRGQFSDALTCYTKAVEADPGNYEVRTHRVRCYCDLGQHQLALQDCDAVLQFGLQIAGPSLDRGLILLGLNRLDEALAAYEQAKRIEPQSLLAAAGIAEVYARKGECQEAAPRYKALLAACPYWPGVHLNLGRCWLEKSQFDKAIVEFDTESKDWSGSALQARYWRAKALDRAGRKTEALTAYQDFHQQLTTARRAGSKTTQNLKTFGLYTLIGAALLQPGLGLASVIDDPAPGFTKAYDDLDADAVQRIKALSANLP